MENFENKILGVVCNDAGGAEVVSSWIKNNKYKTLYCLSGPALKIFKKKLKFKINFSLKNVISKSDVIMTGTSLKSKAEVNAIKYARRKNKLSFSFLDHWVNYKERFIRDNQKFFPDNIVVTDSHSKKLAKKIFNKSIKIIQIENPYLKNFKKKTKKIILHKFNAVYFSSNLNKTNHKYSDEFYLKKGVDFFKKKYNLEKLKILVRQHPSEKKNKFLKFKIKGTKIYLDKNLNLIDTISENNFFFGFESMALVAASVSGKNTFSFKSKYKKDNVIPKMYINSYI